MCIRDSLKTVQQVVELLGFLAAAGLFKEVLLGLHGTHAVLTRQPLGTADGVNHFNGLVPHLQIAKGTGVHQEHLDLGSAMQLLALIGQRQFHGLLRLSDATLCLLYTSHQLHLHTTGKILDMFLAVLCTTKTESIQILAIASTVP